MNHDPELIPCEIDRTKLPKRALNILHKFDPYIDFMNRQEIKPPCLKIFPKDYVFLAEKLKDTKQDNRAATYRGYRLEKYAE